MSKISGPDVSEHTTANMASIGFYGSNPALACAVSSGTPQTHAWYPHHLRGSEQLSPSSLF